MNERILLPRFETVFVTVVVEIENIFGEYKYHLFSILVCLSLSSSDLFDSPSLFILYRQRFLCFSHLSLLHSFSPSIVPLTSLVLSYSTLFQSTQLPFTLFLRGSSFYLHCALVRLPSISLPSSSLSLISRILPFNSYFVSAPHPHPQMFYSCKLLFVLSSHQCELHRSKLIRSDARSSR